MTITGGSALPKEDIERMMRDAESHAEEDRKRREDAETRNTAESLMYQTEKFLAESGEKIPEDSKAKLNEALGDLRSSLGGSDMGAIRAAQETVSRLSQEIGAAMYQQPGADSAGGFGGSQTGADAGGATGTDAGSDDDVVDAEIVDDEPSGTSDGEERSA